MEKTKRVRIRVTYSGVAEVETEVPEDFELNRFEDIDFDKWPELDRPVEVSAEDWSMEEL